MRGSGGLVQLANVVQVQETVAPKELNHFNRVRSATLTANLAPGRQPRQGARRPATRIAQRKLPAGVKHDLAGAVARVPRVEQQPLLPVRARAGVHLPGARGAVRELHPPAHDPALGAARGVRRAALAVRVPADLNIYSQIGLIMLIGLVTKNAILIVEYANQLRARGTGADGGGGRGVAHPPAADPHDHVLDHLRHPADRARARRRRRVARPLGIAVVGGLLFSTFLTLLLVPVVYTLLARFTHVETMV